MKPIYTKNRVIGLLGGSFNPAHLGHLHISKYALNALGIDEVWWLVSPQNPLKPVGGMADYKERSQFAKKITKGNKRIFVSDIEQKMNTRYTYETLDKLQKLYTGTSFVWMMGADNLATFHHWQQWQSILKLMPVVVFDRSPYSFTSLSSKTYQRMRRFLLNNGNYSCNNITPSLRFIHLKRDNNSSTNIRKKLGNKAFTITNT
ncbi:MAG: nicotinate (nicotinamide) nucleotide adenylyltransferase [Pseudomonadota bacterium]